MLLSLLVLSDTHGRRDRVAALMARTSPDTVLFLGDGLRDLDAIPDHVCVRAVRGNCDHFAAEDTPFSRVVEIGGYRLYLTHGHREGVKYGPEAAIEQALANHADALLYGHTHRPVERILPAGTVLGAHTLTRPFVILCPGSLGDPPDGIPTFGTLTLAPGGILPAIGKL